MKPDPIKRISAPAQSAEVWRVERRIPLSVVLAVALHIAALIIWAVWLEARVAALEVEQPAFRELTERFARVEERLDMVRAELERLRGR